MNYKDSYFSVDFQTHIKHWLYAQENQILVFLYHEFYE